MISIGLTLLCPGTLRNNVHDLPPLTVHTKHCIKKQALQNYIRSDVCRQLKLSNYCLFSTFNITLGGGDLRISLRGNLTITLVIYKRCFLFVNPFETGGLTTLMMRHMFKIF